MVLIILQFQNNSIFVYRDIKIIFTGTSYVKENEFKIFLSRLDNYSEATAIVKGVYLKCKGVILAINDVDSKEKKREKVGTLLGTARPTNQYQG